MPAQTTKSIQEALEVVSRSWTDAASAPRSAADWRAAAQHVEQASATVDEQFRWAFVYHRARLMGLGGDRAQAVTLLDELLAHGRQLPEALWLKIQLTHREGDEQSNQQRWEIEDRLGELLPISSWGRLRDARLEVKQARQLSRSLVDNPELPVIPMVDRARLLRIAQLYEDMRLFDQAGNAYREAIYGGFLPPEFPDAGAESWISEPAADAWMSTARCEAAAGRQAWAVHALLMAVAPSGRRLLRAKSAAETIFESNQAAAAPAVDLRRLTEIADLYRDSNLHPRALAALKLGEKLPNADLSQRQRDLTEAWKHLISECRAGRDEICFLFGRRVADVRDPVDLSPPHFKY